MKLDTKGYIGTGSGSLFGPPYYGDFWEYNPSTDAWLKKADFGGTARTNAAGFSIGTKGYIGTGLDNAEKQDFWEYDPSADAWTQRANYGGAARSAACGFSIGTKGYIGIGGDNSAGTFYQDFWEYNPGPIGINEAINPITCTLFPNPFSIQTTISLSKEVRNASLILYDLSGKEVKNILFSGKQVPMERGSLLSGMYFYQIVSESEPVSSGKLIIH